MLRLCDMTKHVVFCGVTVFTSIYYGQISEIQAATLKIERCSYAPKRRYISVACPWFGYEKSDTVQIMAQTNPQTQTPLFYHRHRNHIKQLKTHKSEVKCIHRQRPSHTTCIHFDAASSETLKSTFFLFISLRYERAC